MRISALIVRIGLVLMALLVLASCSQQGQKSTSEPPNPYLEWETFLSGNIKIRYAAGHPQEGTFEDVTQFYRTLLNRSCGFLKIDVPKDTLHIIYHTGFGQGREMTGHLFPYATSDTIYFWLPSFYGPTLMQYLIPRWQPGEPRHVFLKHGLIALLDFSGQNYHTTTAKYIHEGKFIPLSQLAITTDMHSDTERYQTAMSASFVDYIVYTYGLERLESLYVATGVFEDEVRRQLDLSMDSLEDQWLELAGEGAKMDTAGYRRHVLDK